jgi:hypothetical protein
MKDFVQVPNFPIEMDEVDLDLGAPLQVAEIDYKPTEIKYFLLYTGL